MANRDAQWNVIMWSPVGDFPIWNRGVDKYLWLLEAAPQLPPHIDELQNKPEEVPQ